MCRDSFTWGKFSKKRNPIENFCAKEYESHGKKGIFAEEFQNGPVWRKERPKRNII